MYTDDISHILNTSGVDCRTNVTMLVLTIFYKYYTDGFCIILPDLSDLLYLVNILCAYVITMIVCTVAVSLRAW